jgi:hypothetical protein
VSEPSNDPGLDVLRIMRVLNDHGVEYLLVGGAAAVIHGAERQTQDFECVAQTGQENLQRLALAMRELNAGDLDILADIPDRYGQHMRFEGLNQRADDAVVGGLVVASPPSMTSSRGRCRLIDRRTGRRCLNYSACERYRTRTRTREPIPPAR